jgi:type IV pilus assembly protein PilQ
MFAWIMAFILLSVAGTVEAQYSGGNGSEKIEVTFEEPEKDILTRRAMDKLEVIIESLEFSNADLRNVIRIIGERLDINFIFDAGEISGKVTLRLRNVRLRDALDSILTTRRLAIVADRSGIFRIVPDSQVGRKAVETRTEVITLNWISSLDVKETMEPFISDGFGKMQANEESNTLIVTDVPPQLEVIKGLIREIDKAERQVAVEARLADVNIGAIRELGTRWTAHKPNEVNHFLDGSKPNQTVITEFDEMTGDPIFGPLLDYQGASDFTFDDPLNIVSHLFEGFAFGGGAGALSLGDTVGVLGDNYNLNATFSFLESRNIVEILANPRVTTLNNVPAKIEIIEMIPYIEAVQGPSGNTTTNEIEFEKAGIEIQVRPIVTPNGFVRLEVEIEQRIFRERVGGGALDPPAIDLRQAETNVIVADGHTVVLGGLRSQRKLEGINGVPWLHRIPLLGWLFKEKNYDQQKLELVLMMTPRIIEEAVSITDREKYWYDKIDTDWHLPDWFFDDVRGITDRTTDVPDED